MSCANGRELRNRFVHSGSMTRYGAQFRLARAFLDFVSGLDPSGVGLAGALLTLIPAGASRAARKTPQDVSGQKGVGEPSSRSA